ncbi:CheB methylesterase [Sulfurimonas denitrificans DSM 1251]|uniref:protein-glutamate methylesterase n=1 Tax=Sulfurimonas denitrificans (strain ATCC 33889 / DSM 1251) TaxID=326298 RepID=Q30P68_SULDN|nr:chemotaxis protein CheB [Sulfurimonas denitrificans]ABB45213.1 CheB methylesterase [Sulfurimonas denitrificans DSM 1251]MDD3443553.1 chemotaxis protein CheB [Sulfurimonas denitrificans]
MLENSQLERVILIGASTGGPGQIEKIIKALPKLKHTTIIIAQHMALDFIASFVKRLGEHSSNSIHIIENALRLRAGEIYICQGITTIHSTNVGLEFHLTCSKEYKYNPDINALFSSFAPFVKSYKTLGIILTGIGDDGVSGCKELSLMGARTITQTQESAIVDGMPLRARQSIESIEIDDTNGIKNKIMEFCN